MTPRNAPVCLLPATCALCWQRSADLRPLAGSQWGRLLDSKKKRDRD